MTVEWASADTRLGRHNISTSVLPKCDLPLYCGSLTLTAKVSYLLFRTAARSQISHIHYFAIAMPRIVNLNTGLGTQIEVWQTLSISQPCSETQIKRAAGAHA